MTNPDCPDGKGLPRAVTVLYAVATGLCAANLYYAQPLLETLADQFEVGSGVTGLVVTMSQLGFAVALLLVVPLGDAVDRWRLIQGLAVATAVSAVGIAVAPSIWLVVACSIFLGGGASAAQVLVSIAAVAGGAHRRGAVVGTVMTGLLVGILLARTVSGVVADVAGWRAVFWMAAAVQLAVAVAAARRAASRPRDDGGEGPGYAALLGGMGGLVRASPRLRATMLLGGLNFATFSILWTTLAFRLSEEPYDYSEAVIGLFGLLGISGALAAAPAGRAADRGRRAPVTVALTATLAVSFVVLGLGSAQLVAIGAGIVAIDLAVQGVHVSNQTVVFGLPETLHSRANSAYMSAYFLGGAIGSLGAGFLYAARGWTSVCVLGAVVGLACLLVGAVRERLPEGPV